jgi:DNA sulfur modification protein DndB
MATGNLSDDAALARDYWEAVAEHIPAWTRVMKGEMAASEIREGYLHSHGIALQALGQAGNALLHTYPDDWRKRLSKLRKLDWPRGNARLWEGRALVDGKVIKGNTNLVLTTNVIKRVLGLPLDVEQQKVEDAYSGGRQPEAQLVAAS